MKQFIFLTDEGFTFSPDNESCEPDMENLQVLGIISADDEKEAFNRLVEENPVLSQHFKQVICQEIRGKPIFFSLKNEK